MSLESCQNLGFDAAAIAARLDMLGFSEQNLTLDGEALQDLVIRPNAESILEGFYASLTRIDGFNDIVARHSSLGRIIDTQRRYLLSLGVDFDTTAYFENRLAIGSVHHRIGVSQSQYQCANQRLQFLLTQNIPQKMWQDRSAAEAMIQFILKITALDMSLVIESYCASRTSGLEKSLINERGETERLHHLAITDWLTDLHNHSNSRQLLLEALRRSRSDGSPLSVIMADLDHFKKINDSHGHLVGDEVLRIAAGRMVSAARSGDEIGRYGGEEFLFILRHTGIDDALDVAERVRLRVNSDAFNARSAELRLSVSLGIAEACDGDDVDTLIDRADAALYSAKLAGRDRVCAEAPATSAAAGTASASPD
jgi:diguanylate cyclase (GGDEF)-like protein